MEMILRLMWVLVGGEKKKQKKKKSKNTKDVSMIDFVQFHQNKIGKEL